MSLRSWILTFAGPYLTEAQHQHLATEATAALRGGVRLTRAEWLAMAPAERRAWEVAGDHLSCADAARAGLAAQGPLLAARVGSAADHGDLEREITDAIGEKERDDRQRALRSAAQDMVDRYGAPTTVSNGVATP